MRTKKIAFAFVAFFILSCSRPPSSSTATSVKDANADHNWALLPFIKADSVNPVLQTGNATFTDPITNEKIEWEQKDVFNPAVAVINDTLFLLYRAQDTVGKPGGTSRIGLAWSIDGMHFTKLSQPVLYPQNDQFKQFEWQGGCEDPRLVQDSSGMYYMTYTAYDGKIARLFIATSTDLLHWQKHGNVFANAYNGKYKNAWSKSGSIISTYKNGKITAVKINGKYWMYWGDKYIWAASSEDLIHWSPIEKKPDEKQLYDSLYADFDISDLKIVVPTRPKKFDSDLVESGPPALLTTDGIVLMYNSRNVPAIGDPNLPEGTYTASQVLLSKNNPVEIEKRMDNYFLKPEKPYEITGQVNRVCFIEALAQYKNKWWLYYGTADSKIAVAVKNF